MLSFRIYHHLRVSRILVLPISRARAPFYIQVFQHVQSLIYIYVYTVLALGDLGDIDNASRMHVHARCPCTR